MALTSETTEYISVMSQHSKYIEKLKLTMQAMYVGIMMICTFYMCK